MSNHEAAPFDDLKAFVLDVLRYGMQSLPTIVKLLNDRSSVGWRLNWPHDFNNEEVLRALQSLAEVGLVTVLVWDKTRTHVLPSETVPSADDSWQIFWFELSDTGQQVLDDWTPPVRIGYDERQ